MLLNIAQFAGRNDIEPMFGTISLPMMILSCLPSAIYTFKYFGIRQFSITCQRMNRPLRTNLIWMFFSIFFCIFFLKFKKSICLSIFLFIFFLGLCRKILPAIFIFYSCAKFAPSIITIFCAVIFVKFRNWFNRLAFRTEFCLNYIRHNFLLYRELCLEPLIRPILMCGSFYYKRQYN